MTTSILLVSLFANVFLTFLKIIVGILGNSKSLVADGVHSLSDLSTDIIAIFGDKLSKKPADDDHPYGHGKINYLTSVLISVLIIIMGFTLFKNSFSVSSNIPEKITILVVCITIIIKYFVSSLLIKVGKKENNSILIASGRESFGDVFSSILVLVSLVTSQFSNQVAIFKYTDMLGSIIISIIIVIMGFRILMDNFSSLIGQMELSQTKIDEVLSFLDENIKNKEIKIVDILLLKYGTYYRSVIKILVPENLSVKELIQINKSIENYLLNSCFNIKYVNIDIDIIEGSVHNAGVTRSRNSKRNFKKKTIKQKDN